MRNLRRKKPPQRTRRMTPRMTSRFKRGHSAASETEKRRNGLRAVPAFQFVKKLCFSAQLLYERSLTRLRAQSPPLFQAARSRDDQTNFCISDGYLLQWVQFYSCGGKDLLCRTEGERERGN